MLELFERRGICVELPGVDGLIAACARNDVARVGAIAEKEPTWFANYWLKVDSCWRSSRV